MRSVSEGRRRLVDLPAGEHDVKLRVLPRSGVGGGATSLAALVVAAVAVWRSRRSGSAGDTIRPGRPVLRELLFFASPFVLVVLAFALVHEHPRPPRELLTPAGRADDCGRASRRGPIDARWEEGVTLVASRILTQPTSILRPRRR